jgi:hypothetical protein
LSSSPSPHPASGRLDLVQYLDDVIFGAESARASLSSAHTLIAVLRRFGWLVHPTKCIGTSVAVQAFQALGVWVDLLTQTYSVPPAAVRRILDAAEALATGPVEVPVRLVARFKGLLASTWLSTGIATRVRTRALAAVVDSRPAALSGSARAVRRAWNVAVLISPTAREEARWWIWFLPRYNGAPIRPRPFDSSVDGDIASDASDVGVGAVVSTRHSDPADSGLLRALAARAPAGFSMAAVVAHARWGLEFAQPLPDWLLEASSTLRELYGIAVFITAVAHLLRGGRFRVFLDNLGCVFIMGGVVPEAAIGGLPWGEYVTGGSPHPELQRLALQLFSAQLEGGFTLQAVWRPRELNVRADYLSRVATMLHHEYCLLPALFRWLDDCWGPHTIDRFASIDTRQPLAPPHTGRFCAQYFHPEAEWTDAFSVPWGAENNWLFPPYGNIAQAVSHLRASRAVGTLIVPYVPWAPWLPALRRGRQWDPIVTGLVRLGSPRDCLRIPSDHRRDFSSRCVLIALRLDGRAVDVVGRAAGPGAP